MGESPAGDVTQTLHTIPGGPVFYVDSDGIIDVQVVGPYGRPWFMYRVREAHDADRRGRHNGFLKPVSLPVGPYSDYAPWHIQAVEPDILLGRRGMAGWDRRPRVEHPVPWETWQKPGQGLDRFYHAPTPAELATHVQDALDWLRDNPAAPARCALIYAWNENDEGGWLVPTLAADGTPDTRRIEALGHVLRRPPAEEPRR